MSRTMKFQAFILIILSLSWVGCAPETGPHKTYSQNSGQSAPQGGPLVSFNQVSPVFQQYCAACHPTRSAPDWANYNQAKAFAENGRLLRRVIVQKNMPPLGSPQASAMKDSDRQIIAQWVASETGAARGEATQAGSTSAAADQPAGDTPLIAQSCLQCHGSDNPSLAHIPRIQGQNYRYLQLQLHRFKWQERMDPSGTMNDIASRLSDGDITVLSRFFSSPTLILEPQIAPQMDAPEQDRIALQIMMENDKALLERGRIIAERNCNSCHRNTNTEYRPSSNLLPVITGQSLPYLRSQLLTFRADSKRSPLMHDFTKNLSNAQIEALASYFNKIR